MQVMVTVDSKHVEYRPGTIYAGFPSSPGFRAGGQSYSKLTGFYSTMVLGQYALVWYLDRI